MSLSEPVQRELSHTRQLEIKGYRRADGLWDIEGHLTDTKPFDYDGIERPLRAGEPIHEMWLRLTIDLDLLVHRAEAWTAHGPYGMCGETNPNFAALAGLRIGPGWNRRAKERVGGVRGCTHIVEMLGQMATTAMQTVWEARSERRQEPPAGLVNSCHAYRSDSPLVKRLFPEHYTGG